MPQIDKVTTEMTFWHGYSPADLLHIFRTPLLKNTSGRKLPHSPMIIRHKTSLNQNIPANFHLFKVNNRNTRKKA